MKAVLIFWGLTVAASIAWAQPSFTPPPAEMLHCASPGQNLTFACTNIGAGITTWGGGEKLFSGCSVVLRHNRFIEGALGHCDNGRLAGYSLGSDGDTYRSEFTINGVEIGDHCKTVNCTHHIGSAIKYTGTATITLHGQDSAINETARVNNVELYQIFPDEYAIQFRWQAGNASACGSTAFIPYTYEFRSRNCNWQCETFPQSDGSMLTHCGSNRFEEYRSLNASCDFAVDTLRCGVTLLNGTQFTVTGEQLKAEPVTLPAALLSLLGASAVTTPSAGQSLFSSMLPVLMAAVSLAKGYF